MGADLRDLALRIFAESVLNDVFHAIHQTQHLFLGKHFQKNIEMFVDLLRYCYIVYSRGGFTGGGGGGWGMVLIDDSEIFLEPSAEKVPFLGQTLPKKHKNGMFGLFFFFFKNTFTQQKMLQKSKLVDLGKL